MTLTENGTTTFTPTVTATYSLSNQQYPSGTVNGTSQVGLTFGGSTNGNGGSMGSWSYYPLMNSIGSTNNTMFSACSTCGANSGMNVSSDKAISLFTSANALITSSSTNKVALNARVYYGDLTITFNRPVTNPVLHFAGMGGFYQHSGNSNNKVYFQGFSAEFDLASSGMSLSKLDGSTYFTVASNQIRNTASQLSYSSVGVTQYSVTRHGASGSALVTGTNITTIKLRIYLRGDGGRISTTSGAATSASSGQYVAWSNAASNPFAAGGAFHSGDVFLVGASLAAPIEDCSNGIDDDWDGLVDCNDPDCKIGVGKTARIMAKSK